MYRRIEDFAAAWAREAAEELRKTDQVAVGFFGDGAVNNGAFHEGLNLATVYGFALIIAALIEALIYNALCNRKEAEFARAEQQNEENASRYSLRQLT